MQAIATEAVLAPLDPGGPGMFRCAAPGYVGALYETAGLHEVAEWDVGVELVTDSPAQYWEMISEHVSLAGAALAQVGEPARERIAKAVIEGRHLRTRRQGKDSGRGPLHRRQEVGTPGLERLRTVAEPRSSSWQPEIADARLTSPSRARLTQCDRSCSIIERTLPRGVDNQAAAASRAAR